MPAGAHADSNLIFRNKNGGYFPGPAERFNAILFTEIAEPESIYVKNGAYVQNNTLVFNDSGMTNLTLASARHSI